MIQMGSSDKLPASPTPPVRSLDNKHQYNPTKTAAHIACTHSLLEEDVFVTEDVNCLDLVVVVEDVELSLNDCCNNKER